MYLSRQNGVWYLWFVNADGRKRKIPTHTNNKSEATQFPLSSTFIRILVSNGRCFDLPNLKTLGSQLGFRYSRFLCSSSAGSAVRSSREGITAHPLNDLGISAETTNILSLSNLLSKPHSPCPLRQFFSNSHYNSLQ